MLHSIHSGWARIVGLCVAFVMTALLAIASARAEPPSDTVLIETPDGPRRAILLPAPRQPAPTVVVLHGAINSAGWAVRRFGFAEAADAHGFAAVFPQSRGLQWNDGRGGVGASADDVGFLRRLAGELIANGVAEPERVYIAGVSNGGMMTLRMVCEAAELFAGAATVVASMPAATGVTCRPGRPVPVIMFNGTADPLVPYNGGGIGPLNMGSLVWGVERTAAYLAGANRCGSTPHAADATFDDTSVTRIVWSHCARGADVTLYSVNGGNHQVLGRNRIFSARKDALSAAETILTEFAAIGARI